MKVPSLAVVIAVNHSVREVDEWFQEPDDLDLVQTALSDLADETDPVIASAVCAARLARLQAFTEGNKRTAVLVSRWILDHNGINGLTFIPADDRELAKLLMSAARGTDVRHEVIELFQSRR